MNVFFIVASMQNFIDIDIYLAIAVGNICNIGMNLTLNQFQV